MEHKPAISTKHLVLTALLAALTVVGSAIRISVPSVVGTSSFHLGNILCALSGLLLGPWLGGLAAGLGSMLYDFTNPAYISESWITFLTKGAYGLAVGLVVLACRKNGMNYLKAILATCAGALTYAALYLFKTYLYNGIIIHDLTHEAALVNVVAKLPSTTFNAVVAVVFAPILYFAISKALEKNHLTI